MKRFLSALLNRSVIQVSDVSFLQRLTTQDMLNLPAYTLFLNGKGRILFDAFVVKNDSVLLDVDAEMESGLMEHLAKFNIRNEVKFQKLNLKVWAIWKEEPPENAILDPRLEEIGYRLYANEFKSTGDYYSWRTSLNVPEAMEIKDKLPFNYNMDRLNALNFKKGCYLGQELTSRTHHLGVIRKRAVFQNGKFVLLPSLS